MWVKVPEVMQFGDRRALASIDRAMFINAGLPIDQLRRFAEIPEFNEELVRRLLARKYDDVSSWQLHAVCYRIESDSLEVFVSSPNFDEVPCGSICPRI